MPRNMPRSGAARVRQEGVNRRGGETDTNSETRSGHFNPRNNSREDKGTPRTMAPRRKRGKK